MGPIIKDWDCNTAWQVWRHATSSDFPISVFLSSPWKVLVSVSQARLVPGCKLHMDPDKPGGVPMVEAAWASSSSRVGAVTVGHQHPALEDVAWHYLVRQSCCEASSNWCLPSALQQTNILWLIGHRLRHMAIPEEARMMEVSVPFRMVAHTLPGSLSTVLMLEQTLSNFGNIFLV